jgi:hypothetical protein
MNASINMTWVQKVVIALNSIFLMQISNIVFHNAIIKKCVLNGTLMIKL